MQTITVLVNDNYENTPNPLMYTVKVTNPSDDKEVFAAVTKERAQDLQCFESELNLTLVMAFAGNVFPLQDWRL